MVVVKYFWPHMSLFINIVEIKWSWNLGKTARYYVVY